MYILGKRSRGRLKGVHPTMVAIFVEAIQNSPIDFGIPAHGGRRTESEQYALYSIGRFGDKSRIITYRDGTYKKSKHQDGFAIDFYPIIDGKPNWEIKNFEIVARHIQKVAWDRYKIKLMWGGDWRMKDYPHMQMPKKYD